MGERKIWVDYVKVYGLLLVLLGHLSYTSLSTEVIYAFHMPLFFIVSGYLHKDNTPFVGKAIIKILKRLLIPYLFFSLLFYGFVSLLSEAKVVNPANMWGGGGVSNTLSISTFKHLVVGMPQGMVGPLWFVFTLMIIKMMQVVMEYIHMRCKCIYVALTLVLFSYIAYVVIFKDILLPIYIARPILAFPFFTFGRCYYKIKNVISNKIRNKKMQFGIAFLLLVSPIIAYFVNGSVDIYNLKFGKSMILYYTFGILGSMGVLLLFEKFEKIFNHISNSWIVSLSDGSILVIAYHSVILYILSRSLTSFNLLNDIFIARAALCICVLLFCVFPIKFLLKYCPIILGK